MTTLSERVRRARTISKLTQSQLSERLGVLRGAVTQWEHPDGTLPSMRHLIAIAQHTGVNLEWLGTGRGEVYLDSSSQTCPVVNGERFLDEIETECLRLLRCMPRRVREQFVSLMRAIVR